MTLWVVSHFLRKERDMRIINLLGIEDNDQLGISHRK